MNQYPQAKQVKERYKEAILSRQNVVGVGVGYKQTDSRTTDQVSVVVLVRRKVPKAGLPPQALVPQELNGVPTDVVQVGDLRAQQSPTDRWRPAPGGVSIGHYQITAGTLGCVVRDRASGDRLILSNNHVLANSNNASIGDPILQPGPYDGGSQGQDIIAHLERFVPIQFGVLPGTCGLASAYASIGNTLAGLLGSSHRLQTVQVNAQAVNQVDAALARPVNDSDVLDEILEIGVINGTAPVELGMVVRKSGRTTGFTTGEVTVVSATVNVSYGPGRTATFENQIVAGPMSQGGDSGSLVVAGNAPLAVGLLFAGSEQSTIFSPIQLVLDSLQVDIGGAQSSQAANPQVSIERAEAVRRAYEDELKSKPNVVGVGVGYQKKGGANTGQVGLVVMVERKVPLDQLAPQDVIPSQIEGVPVDVQEVGEIRAQ